MATSHLNLHSGGQLVTVDELRAVPTPPPEGRWRPISHLSFLERVTTTLTEAGYEIREQKLALHRNGARFFGTLDLATSLGEGVSLCCGIRSSHDKSYPLGWACGSRIHVCSNLAFSGELMVKHKHSTFGEQRFAEAMARAIVSLGQFKQIEAQRIERMRKEEVTADQADALILRSFDRGIISAPQLPKVIKEWREPAHEEFKPRTRFNLLQAFTSAIGDRVNSNPQRYVLTTMRLNSLLATDDYPRLHQPA